jgi:Xaa-Pro aminopeptidase
VALQPARLRHRLQPRYAFPSPHTQSSKPKPTARTVFFAYAVVTPDRAVLFLDPAHATDAITQHLGAAVDVRPYASFYGFLADLARTTPAAQRILLGERASLAVARALGGEVRRAFPSPRPPTHRVQDRVAVARSPVADLKAVKNDVEIAGFRACHVRDGAALARFFAWLEERLSAPSAAAEPLSEAQAADQLEQYRSELAHFKGLSFPTISAAGANGAVIHYSPVRDDCAAVRRDEMYLCDSGAQFLDGTTDVTRTWVRRAPRLSFAPPCGWH